MLSLGGCAMFSSTPPQIVQGAEVSAQFAALNKQNVRAVNNEFHHMFSIFIKRYVAENLWADAIPELDKLHSAVAKRFYRPADINAEISRALADYLKTPGIGLSNIISILQVIGAKTHEPTH